jgi:MFS family permease
MATYAMALTAMGLVRFPIALLGGHWVDALGLTLLARFYILPYAIALLTAALIGGNIGIWVLMLGAGFGMSISNTIGDSLLVRLWGKNHLGKVRSLKSSFMVFSTGITPALLGFLLDMGVKFQSILLGMLLFLIISWLLAQPPIRQAQQLELTSN